MNVKTLVNNGLLAALYIAVSVLVQPFGFTNIQFRLSELFNHLIVFNKKYFLGITLGVFLANLFLSPLGIYDLIFGVGQSVISLLMTMGVGRFIESIWVRMIANTIIFSFNMFIIAIMLNLALGLPFLITWLTTAIGEFVVMALGIPIIYALHKRMHFDKLV
ncbi:QueT transporter family protein [Virgibacillus alimentarius]|uniref:Membrane protein n=1 Tax=Virgibacillus alimentarius TaxID=698769 RepID=A0ABS4S7S2_9BACI|nr:MULTISPECIES: QueT transporter family protein [Virgibacillus]MBP2257535.1 putative membrane protein [Virgibacillus alimentarius]HLR68887.1 QueT transporter family protein [Virgibacillus sp.]